MKEYNLRLIVPIKSFFNDKIDLHPTNIFYIQIVPTDFRLDHTQNLSVNWIIKQ